MAFQIPFICGALDWNEILMSISEYLVAHGFHWTLILVVRVCVSVSLHLYMWSEIRCIKEYLKQPLIH